MSGSHGWAVGLLLSLPNLRAPVRREPHRWSTQPSSCPASQPHWPRLSWGAWLGGQLGPSPKGSVDFLSWPRERLCIGNCRNGQHRSPMGSALPLTCPRLTQGVPVASIWQVGAQAAPNLLSEDWLQDWNILGAEQEAAGKRGRVRCSQWGPGLLVVQVCCLSQATYPGASVAAQGSSAARSCSS